MTREEAKKYILENARNYFKRDKSGKGYLCPVCGSGGGAHGTGITENPSARGHFTCWAGCFTNADIFEIVGRQYNIDNYNEQLQKLCEVLGITIDKSLTQPISSSFKDSAELFKIASAQLGRTDYHRGISIETLSKFHVGYIEHWKHPKTAANDRVPASPRLIIPNDGGGYLARDTRTNLTEQQKKYIKSRVSPTGLFNSASLKSEEPVYIVEGEIDALSIIDTGGQAVALCSVVNVKRLLEVVKENKPQQPLIICLDVDEAGQKAAVQLETGLSELDIFSYRHKLPEDYKDANEFLMADRASFCKWVALGKNPIFEREAVAFRLIDFLEVVKKNREGRAIPTGFANLDEILDGGLYPGLYIVGAISSLGKTTFCLQMADNIARAGYGVLIFSLEMSAHELIAKTLSRESYINGTCKNALTTRDVLKGIYNDTKKDLLLQAIEKYKEFGQHIIITEGVGLVGIKEITEKVKEYMKYHDGKPPVILIDYLQIIAPYDIRATDKQNTDKAVLELKRLSRDYQIPVIGISSFNRENYSAPVSMSSFKESGAIEYSSDVLIGLQYFGFDYKKGEKEAERQQRLNALREQIDNAVHNGGEIEIQVKILKHRNGRKGKLRFDFSPKFNHFRARGEYQAC